MTNKKIIDCIYNTEIDYEFLCKVDKVRNSIIKIEKFIKEEFDDSHELKESLRSLNLSVMWLIALASKKIVKQKADNMRGQ